MCVELPTIARGRATRSPSRRRPARYTCDFLNRRGVAARQRQRQTEEPGPAGLGTMSFALHRAVQDHRRGWVTTVGRVHASRSETRTSSVRRPRRMRAGCAVWHHGSCSLARRSMMRILYHQEVSGARRRRLSNRLHRRLRERAPWVIAWMAIVRGEAFRVRRLRFRRRLRARARGRARMNPVGKEARQDGPGARAAAAARAADHR